MRHRGFEPRTTWLKVKCSTTWANAPSVIQLVFSRRQCPEPESNQWHEDFQSSALPTELSGQKKLRGQDLNLRPSGYEPDELPDCSTPRQYLINYMHIFIKYTLSFGIYIPNGWRRIRTFEGGANRFTVCPLWPLGNPSLNRNLLYMKYLNNASTFL